MQFEVLCSVCVSEWSSKCISSHQARWMKGWLMLTFTTRAYISFTLCFCSEWLMKW